MVERNRSGDSHGDLANNDFIGVGEEILATGKGYTIEWMHVPTGKIVKFKAILTDYSDSFASNWNSEEVYGRMDPMQTFTSTTRTITLGWALPSVSIEEARQNMEKFALLASMLYPSYDVNPDARLGGATTIATSPLFKLKVVNLVSSGTGGVKSSGLLGTCNGFDFSPDLDVGFFDSPNELLPKLFELSCEFSVLHQHPLGWTNEGKDSEWRGYVPGAEGVAGRPPGPNHKWLYGQQMYGIPEVQAKAGGTRERQEAGESQVLNQGD